MGGEFMEEKNFIRILYSKFILFKEDLLIFIYF